MVADWLRAGLLAYTSAIVRTRAVIGVLAYTALCGSWRWITRRCDDAKDEEDEDEEDCDYDEQS